MKPQYFRLVRFTLLLLLLFVTTMYGVSNPAATDYELMESHPPMVIIIALLIVNEALLIKSGWKD